MSLNAVLSRIQPTLDPVKAAELAKVMVSSILNVSAEQILCWSHTFPSLHVA